jgi:hypothetical protein
MIFVSKSDLEKLRNFHKFTEPSPIKRPTSSELQIEFFVSWVEAGSSCAGFRTSTQPTKINVIQLLPGFGRNPTRMEPFLGCRTEKL